MSDSIFPIFNEARLIRKEYRRDQTISNLQILVYDGTEEGQRNPIVFNQQVIEQPKRQSEEFFERCIPNGRYMFGWTWNNRYGNQFIIKNVPSFKDVFLTTIDSKIINSSGKILIDKYWIEYLWRLMREKCGAEPMVMPIIVSDLI